jgi:mannose-6-phosphate isomerase-like protein (cupin superfamily)
MDLSTHALSADPDAVSPDGSADIRYLLKSPQGDVTHAVCRTGQVAPTHHLPELDEAYYVLAGEGEIWRATPSREAVTSLRPGRWVQMPAGMKFQYRANKGSSLVLLVMVLPSWRPELFHTVPGGRWPAEASEPAPPIPESDLVDDWMAGDMHHGYDDLAPDGSEIRNLACFDKGSLSHCTLASGVVSAPVRHRTIHEIWYVLEGHGELWRSSAEAGEKVELLWPGVAVDIPLGTSFQFRATGLDPLRMVLLTMPRWTGADEAIPVPQGYWSF